MSILSWLQFALGAAIVLLVFYDLFQSVVLPRPAVGRGRLAPKLVTSGWRVWRWFGTRHVRESRRENFLAIFGPAGLIALLLIWAAAVVAGYALMLSAFPGQVRPPFRNLGDAVYFSAVSMLTIGYGDIAPVAPLARTLATLEAATGLGLVALVISLLFTLYGSFQRREELVVALDALAGAPPSGMQMLETAAKFRMPAELNQTFDEWRAWSAAVLESHLAYPLLAYFRSSHDNEAWINSFGAVLDAATLVLTTVEDGSEGPARLMFKVGNHLVEDFMWYFGLGNAHEAGVEREEFDAARERLAHAGYPLRDPERAWSEFQVRRSQYASPLNRLALWFAIIPAQWIGDRSYLPHRAPDRRPQVATAGR